MWATVPDAELIRAASIGSLKTSAGVEKQVRRMLADGKSEALATRFGSQWLRLQDLDKIFPDYLLYPQYDDTLARAMKKETELFFDSIVREDRSVLDLITADYSFVNERLAIHYNIPNITGHAFQRVTLPPYRRGLLGQGSILTLTSVADRTSPVAARQVGEEGGTAGSPPPPRRPTCRRSMIREGQRRRQDAVDARAHGAAPRQPELHLVPPRDRSARPALENFDVTARGASRTMSVRSTWSRLYDWMKMEARPASAPRCSSTRPVPDRLYESMLTYALGRRARIHDMR